MYLIELVTHQVPKDKCFVTRKEIIGTETVDCLLRLSRKTYKKFKKRSNDCNNGFNHTFMISIKDDIKIQINSETGYEIGSKELLKKYLI